MDNKPDEKAEAIIKREQQLRQRRSNWENHWRDIARFGRPDYRDLFQSDGLNTEGEKRMQDVVDSTYMLMIPRHASVMESLATPQNSRWHYLATRDPALRKDRDTSLWLDDVTEKLHYYRNQYQAGFWLNIRSLYLDAAAFATGGMFIDKPENGKGLRYRAMPLPELFIATNHSGLVDTTCRSWRMTARQIVQMWPDIKSKRVRDCAQKSPEDKFKIIHLITPRSDYEPGRLDYKGKKWASCYVLEESKELLSEGGYNSFPCAIARYDVVAGEDYGRGPGMWALPSAKTLNEQKRTVLKQGHRAVDPVLLAYDDGVLDTISLKAGAVNMGGVSSDGRPLVQTLPTGNLSLAREMMEQEAKIIKDIFGMTLFEILVEDRREMTATEVIERAREKGALIAPMAGRLMSEFLGPMIDREIDVLAAQGLLPPIPQALLEAGAEYEVQYDSPLSRMQKAEEVAGGMRVLAQVAELATIKQDPTLFDNFNFDEMIPDIAYASAMPNRWINTKEAIEELRANRNAQVQQQQLVDAAPAMASIVKATSPNAR